LAVEFLDAQAQCKTPTHTLAFKLLLDHDSAVVVPDYLAQWPVRRTGRYRGHLWEQIDLARFAPQDWLLCLCNTGPLWRKNQILFLHDAQVFAIPHNFDWRFRWWYQSILKIAGRCSRLVLTNSAFSRAELARYARIPPAKITVAPLGCTHALAVTPQAPAQWAQWVQEKPHLQNQAYVLVVASASPNKNFAAVVQALALLGDAAPCCVIVGQRYAQVFRDGAPLALDPTRVLELGYVPEANLAWLYQHALCLLYPSLYEGFGLPPLEAMLHGCPAIVSNTGALPEVCGDAVLYCDPQAPSTLAAAIAQLVQAQPQRAAIKARSRAHAAQFTWQHTSRVVLEAILQATAPQTAAQSISNVEL
jgi:glycosyltransferase involved in cell wall biosynthesis